MSARGDLYLDGRISNQYGDTRLAANGQGGASGVGDSGDSDAESEAAETQVWIEFATKCGYLDKERAEALFRIYDEVLRTLVGMIAHSGTWTITPQREE